MKVCIVSSSGGHLTEVRLLKPAYLQYEHFYVLNDKALLPEDMRGCTYFIAHSERDWKFLLNLWEAYRILRKEQPAVILSMGAGPAVPFALVGKLIYRMCVVYVETITRVKRPSVTGRIMYWLSDYFYYQHRSLASSFPKGCFAGSLI